MSWERRCEGRRVRILGSDEEMRRGDLRGS